MIVKCDQGDFDFIIPRPFYRVGIKVSGGIDSACLFYLLSKYKKLHRPDLKIIPITGIIRTRPWQYVKANIIKEKISEILKIDINSFYEPHYTFDMETVTIRSAQYEQVNKLYIENIIDCHVWGVTANPPFDVLECMIPGRDLYRDPLPDNTPHPIWNGLSYNPFANINKRGVASVYKNEGILESVFPLTRSCEVDNVYIFNKPCKRSKCWWCQERNWGFGTYD